MRYASTINAAKSGAQLAGTKLAEFLSRPGVQEFARKAVTEAGVGLAIEQGVPRLLGQEPQARLDESIIRQGVGGLGYAGISKGLAGKFPKLPERITELAGVTGGQLIGQTTANAILPGHQPYPFTDEPGTNKDEIAAYDASPLSTNTAIRFAGSSPIDPEIKDVQHASYEQLQEQQKYKADMEIMRHQHHMELAQAKNAARQIYHHSPADPLATAQSVMHSRTPVYG